MINQITTQQFTTEQQSTTEQQTTVASVTTVAGVVTGDPIAFAVPAVQVSLSVIIIGIICFFMVL